MDKQAEQEIRHLIDNLQSSYLASAFVFSELTIALFEHDPELKERFARGVAAFSLHVRQSGKTSLANKIDIVLEQALGPNP